MAANMRLIIGSTVRPCIPTCRFPVAAALSTCPWGMSVHAFPHAAAPSPRPRRDAPAVVFSWTWPVPPSPWSHPYSSHGRIPMSGARTAAPKIWEFERLPLRKKSHTISSRRLTSHLRRSDSHTSAGQCSRDSVEDLSQTRCADSRGQITTAFFSRIPIFLARPAAPKNGNSSGSLCERDSHGVDP